MGILRFSAYGVPDPIPTMMSDLFILLTFTLLLFVLSAIRKTKKQLDSFEQDVRNQFRFMRGRFAHSESPEETKDEPEKEIPEPLPDPPIEEKAEPKSQVTPPPLPAGVAAKVSLGAESVETPTKAPIPATPHEPSKFESAGKDILRKIWNWIVVGDEHRDEGVTMEFAVVTTWGIRLGVLVIVVGIGFFLQAAIAKGIIGPVGKIALCIVMGAGLIMWGLRMFRGKYKALGQGFCGAGFATLYFSFYTAFHDGLLGVIPSFAMMALVTLAAGFLAIRFNAQLIAILGLICGYGTPLMIRGDSTDLIGLFSYMLLLGAGVFYISWKKEWRLLHYLSFAATFILFLDSSAEHFSDEKFPIYMSFLVAFFVLFSTITFIFHLVNRKKSTILELLFLFLNAGMFFGFSTYFVNETYSRQILAGVTLTMAFFYIGHVWFFLKRNIQDKGLLLAFIGLAAFFVAITLPLALSKGWITVSWAIQGFIMLWIASRMKSEFLRQLAYLLYVIVFVRFLFFDFNTEFGRHIDPQSMGDYFKELLERICVFGLPIVSFFAAGKMFERSTSGNLAVTDSNDVEPWIVSSWAAKAFYWLMIAMGFIYLNAEFRQSANYMFEPIGVPAISILWAGLCLLLLLGRLRGGGNVVLTFLWIFVGATIIKVFLFDAWEWKYSMFAAFSKQPFHSGFGMRLIDHGALLGVLFLGWHLCRKPGGHSKMRKTFGYLGLALLFLYSSLEVWTFLSHYLREFQMGGISIFWALFAIGLLIAGILKNLPVLRGVALALLADVVLKIFFVDLAGLNQLYRVIAFMTLGVLILISPFAYMKYRSSFETETKEE